MSWTNEVVLEFLELYKQEQLLWDPSHHLYRNRHEVNEAWLRMQELFSIKCSVVRLKKKKESLMSMFRENWHKRTVNPNYSINWFAFPIMESFLGPKYNTGAGANSLEQEEITPNKAKYFRLKRLKTRPSTSSTAEKRPHSEDYCVKNESEEHSYLKSPGQKKDMDECELYGQLLIKKLRKLDEHQRDVAMHEIDNILFRAKMHSSSSDTQQNYTSSLPRKMKSPFFINEEYVEEEEYQDDEDPMQSQSS